MPNRGVSKMAIIQVLAMFLNMLTILVRVMGLFIKVVKQIMTELAEKLGMLNLVLRGGYMQTLTVVLMILLMANAVPLLRLQAVQLIIK